MSRLHLSCYPTGLSYSTRMNQQSARKVGVVPRSNSVLCWFRGLSTCPQSRYRTTSLKPIHSGWTTDVCCCCCEHKSRVEAEDSVCFVPKEVLLRPRFRLQLQSWSVTISAPVKQHRLRTRYVIVNRLRRHWQWLLHLRWRFRSDNPLPPCYTLSTLLFLRKCIPFLEVVLNVHVKRFLRTDDGHIRECTGSEWCCGRTGTIVINFKSVWARRSANVLSRIPIPNCTLPLTKVNIEIVIQISVSNEVLRVYRTTKPFEWVVHRHRWLEIIDCCSSATLTE